MANKGVRKRQAGMQTAMDIVYFIMHMVLNVVFYAFIIFLIYRACIFVYDFTYQVFGDTTVDAAPGKNVEINIENGASTMDIASALEVNKVIQNRYSFYIRVKSMSYKIYAGKYILNTSMNYGEILDVITDFKNAIEEPTPTPAPTETPEAVPEAENNGN